MISWTWLFAPALFGIAFGMLLTVWFLTVTGRLDD